VSLVHEALDRNARRRPRSTFLFDEGAAHSFAAVASRSEGIACGLRAVGITEGERVAVILPNSAAFVATLFGVLRAGAVAVPIHPDTTAARLATLLADSGASVVIAAGAMSRVVEPATRASSTVRAVAWEGPGAPPSGVDLADLGASRRADPSAPRISEEDLAAILYTSGSTGVPKGVMLSHLNLLSSAGSIGAYLHNRPDDIVAGILSMAHGYGLQQVLVGSVVGYAVHIERSFAFPFEVMERLAEARVTGLAAVPSMYATILRSRAIGELDLSSIRYLTNAADALPTSFIPRLREVFPSAGLYCMYGMTECTRAAYLEPERVAEKPGSVGRPIPDMDAWVVGPDGRPAATGEVGELVIRGSGVMRGYWGRPRETAAVLGPGFDRTGSPVNRVLRSGDLFREDPDGDLWYVGRRDDVFKTRGEKVAPREVEGAIYELDGVSEVVVVGVPHPSDGHAVKAFVLLRPGVTLDEQQVRRHCRRRLPAHLVPRFVEFPDDLPRTASGKVRRARLS